MYSHIITFFEKLNNWSGKRMECLTLCNGKIRQILNYNSKGNVVTILLPNPKRYPVFFL